MLRRQACLSTMALLLLSCGSPESGDEELGERGRATNADPRYGRGVGQYKVRLSVAGDLTTNLFYALSGWVCSATASLSYSEYEPNHKGQLTKILHEQSSNIVWGSLSNTNLFFTRDYLHKNPALRTTVREYCSRTTYYPCTKQDADGNDYESTCSDTSSFSVSWDCEDSQLPEQVGSSRTQWCTQKSTDWLTIDGYALLGTFFRNFQISTVTTLVDERAVYDFNNCTSTNGEPFYLRLTQGLGGHVGEDDFILHVNIDGKDVVSAESSSGLYTLALAYCPSGNQDSIALDLRGIEDDLIWDDAYASKDGPLTIERGTVQKLVLTRKHLTGTKESTVLVESFR